MKELFSEVERTILDQIEKLNDDSVMGTEIEVRQLVDRSRAISQLASNVVAINQLKLEIVKEMNKPENVYGGSVFGIDAPKTEPIEQKTRKLINHAK